MLQLLVTQNVTSSKLKSYSYSNKLHTTKPGLYFAIFLQDLHKIRQFSARAEELTRQTDNVVKEIKDYQCSICSEGYIYSGTLKEKASFVFL